MLPKFSDAQIAKLSDIASEIAIVSLASVALPAIFVDVNAIRMASGVMTALFFWIISLWLLKGAK